MRYINQIYTALPSELWDNARLLAAYEELIAQLDAPTETRDRVRDFVRFQLVGQRSRRSVVDDWSRLKTFESRAAAGEAGVEQCASQLAEQIAPQAEAAGITFDAVIATTATVNLMPGISYRIARRLPGLVRSDSLMLDLGNVGCTGSSKALNLARSLDSSFQNILVVAVETPTTLVDTGSDRLDIWQGNCTFGDGAAAMWISSDPAQGDSALALEELRYTQRADSGIDLIRWDYRDYYSFALADEKTFDQRVREYVVEALQEAESAWKEEPRWAVHPAGITLLVRISRKLGIPREAIQPSIDQYTRNSNMSSASVLHILKEVGSAAPIGGAVNLLTMGAGFNVVYGRVRRVR